MQITSIHGRCILLLFVLTGNYSLPCCSYQLAPTFVSHACGTKDRLRFGMGPRKSKRRRVVRLMGNRDGNNGDGDGFSELSKALARLDDQWKIQQRQKNVQGWTKLMLEPDDAGSSLSVPAQEEFVYLLEPPYGSLPSSVILFLGGAVLGNFPHIAYSEFLRRISERTGAAVIAAPFEIGIDHFDLAKKSEKRFRKALQKCEEEKEWNPHLPKVALAHSLGAKLFTISLAATGGKDIEGIGFLSFNNFGLSDSIGMAGSFAKELQNSKDPFDERSQSSGSPYSPQENEMFSFFLNLAEQTTKGMGLDFSPGPKDTERLIQMKFTPDLKGKCRLFCFDDDNLDSSESFVEACEEAGGKGPSVSGLPGTHLTPVYVKLGLDDLPEEAQMVAGQVTGGFRGASFGSEEDMNAAVDEVCKWIVGKPPTRGPREPETSGEDRQRQKLPGSVVDAELA